MSPAVAVHIFLCAQCALIGSAAGGYPSSEDGRSITYDDDDVGLIQLKASSHPRKNDPVTEPNFGDHEVPEPTEKDWNIKPIHIKVKLSNPHEAQEADTANSAVDYHAIAENAAQAVQAADSAIASTRNAISSIGSSSSSNTTGVLVTGGPNFGNEAAAEQRQEEQQAINKVIGQFAGSLFPKLSGLFGRNVSGSASVDVKLPGGGNSTGAGKGPLGMVRVASQLAGSLYAFFAGMFTIVMSMILTAFGAVNTGLSLMDMMNLFKGR
eukprot:gnl/TRDRNA2_/TRDRNA2_172244_c5_seq10.p1 gnl/TRDRNA2_/TRDRNA2_172244_c5~~gnl/TRDRNA2_/TRDRNA2_172244_c5_seq10.p1  ORF type:complete len:292 (+),score=32.15 gnl/TRDRNA2_/TRDRNA2_172244_c5_seq10:77-877(+)